MEEFPAITDRAATNATVEPNSSFSAPALPVVDTSPYAKRVAKMKALLAQKTVIVPSSKLPLQYPDGSREIYVRHCYDDEYNRITIEYFGGPKELRDRGVTVTGTPGIGKSMFIVYFFLRYKLQYPKTTFIICSFETDSNLKCVAMWEEREVEDPKLIEGSIRELELKYHNDPLALFLMDESPTAAPSFSRYAVFTNPSETWFSKAAAGTHSAIYMPLWSEEELLDAFSALRLHGKRSPLSVKDFPRDGECDSDVDEMLYRYEVFGGVARTCLSDNISFVHQQLNHLVEEQLQWLRSIISSQFVLALSKLLTVFRKQIFVVFNM